jgi:TorA maturation chaperone TorD
MDREDKESKTYVVEVKKYASGTPEEFLRWRLVFNEQMKNHGYSANYDTVVNLAQAMLAGCSLEAFLNEQRAQAKKNRKDEGTNGVHSTTSL